MRLPRSWPRALILSTAVLGAAALATMAVPAVLRVLILPASAPGSGLAAHRFDNQRFKNPPVRQYTETRTEMHSGSDSDFSGEDFALDLRGLFWVWLPGPFELGLASDDDGRLYLDGKKLVDHSGPHPLSAKTARVWLWPGPHMLAVEYAQRSGNAGLRLLCQGPLSGGLGVMSPSRLTPVKRRFSHDRSRDIMRIFRLAAAPLLMLLWIGAALLLARLWLGPWGWSERLLDWAGAGQGWRATRGLCLSALGIFALALAAGLWLRLLDPFFFDVAWGHDPHLHYTYLKALVDGWAPNYYVPPWYYFWVLLHAEAFSPLLLSGILSQHQWLSLGLGAANLHLFAWTLLGLWKLGGRLAMPRLMRLGWLSIFALMPVVQRSLNMLRPENLMLALMPAVVLLALAWRDELEDRGFAWRSVRLWGLAAVGALLLTQKIGGLTILAPLALVLLFGRTAPWRARLKQLAAGVLLLLVCTTALAGLHRGFSGSWFFHHGHSAQDPNYQHSVPASFFYTFEPGRMWDQPARNNHKHAAWDIMALDLFGDYWQYGVFSHRTPDRRLGGPGEGNLKPELFRARLGLVATALFAFLCLAGVAVLTLGLVRAGPQERRPLALRLGALLPILAGVGYLFVTCSVIFHSGKGDTIKWEYILWAQPLMALLAAQVLDLRQVGRLAWLLWPLLAAVLAVGLMQSGLFL